MNKLLLVFLGMVFFSLSCFAYSIEPRIIYSGTESIVGFEEEGLSMVEVVGVFSGNEITPCGKVKCPEFKTGETVFYVGGKESAIVSASGVEPGDYLFRFSFGDKSIQPVYASLAVKPDYRPWVLGLTVLLVALVFLVERNEEKIRKIFSGN